MKKSKKSGVTSKQAEPAVALAPVVHSWTFLSNHTHVLLCLYRQADLTLREVANMVGITERMVQKIIAELVEANFIEVSKVGRRNTYTIRLSMTLRHPLESHRKIGELLEHLQ